MSKEVQEQTLLWTKNI